MNRIDAHNHFWKFDPIRDSWINNDMKGIQKDFLPADLGIILKRNNFEGCVVVQSDQTEEENAFQLKNAEEFNFIKGIVGWVDLRSPNVDERLQYYSQCKNIKGFRHILQGEAERDVMIKPAFLNGIRQLQQYGFTYDILIFPDQLQYIPAFVSQFPGQPFVIDHIAKPNIKEKKINDWKKDIEAVAKFENVYCKLSGLVTEADWKYWKREDFTPYLNVIVEAFGTGRIMFGSDWPVCQLAASYEEVVGIVEDHFSGYSKNEHENIFAGNAVKFYKL